MYRTHSNFVHHRKKLLKNIFTHIYKFFPFWLSFFAFYHMRLFKFSLLQVNLPTFTMRLSKYGLDWKIPYASHIFIFFKNSFQQDWFKEEEKNIVFEKKKCFFSRCLISFLILDLWWFFNKHFLKATRRVYLVFSSWVSW